MVQLKLYGQLHSELVNSVSCLVVWAPRTSILITYWFSFGELFWIHDIFGSVFKCLNLEFLLHLLHSLAQRMERKVHSWNTLWFGVLSVLRHVIPFVCEKNKSLILNMELSGIFYPCYFSCDNNFSFSFFSLPFSIFRVCWL